MALLGSNMSSEVGLRLLLCPLGSNVVIRTACCSVGFVLPVYSTFKSIESKDQDQQHKWLVYWTVYGSFSVAELFTDKFLHWCPLYYHIKFAFLVWLQLPSVDGARQLYMNHLRPFLQRHQSRLDQLVSFFYGEMVKFVSNHEAEIRIARSLLMKILFSGAYIYYRWIVYQHFFNYCAEPFDKSAEHSEKVIQEIIHPGQRQGTGSAIERPPEHVESSESEAESEAEE